VFGEFPVTGPNIAGTGDGAILDRECVDADAQTIRRSAQEDLPHFGAGLPYGAARLLHRKTAGRDALVGTGRCRSTNHLHAAEIDIEFVGSNLGQRGDDALSDLDLSWRDHHLALPREPDP
jgi:hypothetical protein